ncbi:MAG: glutathione peroxidase [Chitinophagales bacterium]
MNKTIFDFSIDSIDGGKINFADYRGKKLLIVNTASECGFTYQYAQLQELFENYSEKLMVIGLPSNDFGGQEPGSNAEIKEFCKVRYGVTFPLSHKISILKNPHPLIEWLQKQSSENNPPIEIRWNFHKFLFDENGNFLEAFNSATEPADELILKYII